MLRRSGAAARSSRQVTARLISILRLFAGGVKGDGREREAWSEERGARSVKHGAVGHGAGDGVKWGEGRAVDMAKAAAEGVCRALCKYLDGKAAKARGLRCR